MSGLDDMVVAPDLVPRALTAGELVFADGATQVFDADGGTTYVENRRPTRGQWYLDKDGRFGSFWPPSYRSAYDLRWMVEDGAVVGLRFTARDGTPFDGRYRTPGDVVPQEPTLQPTRPSQPSVTQ